MLTHERNETKISHATVPLRCQSLLVDESLCNDLFIGLLHYFIIFPIHLGCQYFLPWVSEPYFITALPFPTSIRLVSSSPSVWTSVGHIEWEGGREDTESVVGQTRSRGAGERYEVGAWHWQSFDSQSRRGILYGLL